MKETGICAKQWQMALVKIWHPFSHCVLCSAIVCFLGMILFLKISLSMLRLKSTEVGLIVENITKKCYKKAFRYSETKSGSNKNN